MRPASLASVLLRILGWIVLLASGTYLLVYLYRWEWNRALISGLFFVAAEVALAASSILRRLTTLERRLDEVTHATRRLPPAEADDAGPFSWLDDQQIGVFVPVLLGVGVILSAVAYGIERVAAASGSWAGDAAAMRRLRRLARPHGSLVPAAVEASSAAPAAAVRFAPPPVHPRAGRAVAWVVVAAVGLVLLVAALGSLAELTMYRADTRPTTGRTTYLLRVELRDGAGDPTMVAQALWLSCRGNLVDVSRARIAPTTDGLVSMAVEPEVATNDDRRFVGCIEDVTLDRVRVDVVGGRDASGVRT